MKDKLKILLNGILYENPIIVLMIGLCPLLAVSTTLTNALCMGIAVIFVLVGSNLVISALRKLIPNQMRIPVFIVIISTFVTIADYTIAAYSPSLYNSLGVFIPLIVVNCIILGRAEGFAYKHSVLESIIDGLGMGLGFTVMICVISAIRELIGNGTLADIKIFGEWYKPAIILILPPGAFLVIGFLMALKNKVLKK